MRAPNGQSMPISEDKNYALAVGGDVLCRCVRQFDAAVRQQSPVVFLLNDNDVERLLGHYSDVDGKTNRQLACFLNEILSRNGLSYTVTTVLAGSQTEYFCRIEREIE